jgi:hypothetical protein
MLCFAGPQLAVAAESEERHPFLERGFSLDVGVFFPDRELDLRVNGSLDVINREIDFDRRRQIKSNDDIFVAELSWRFRGRWSIIGQYFKSTDRNSATLEEEIEWGDVVFNAGISAATGTDFSLTRIFFGRQLDTSKFHEFGIGGHSLDPHWGIH